MKTIFIWIVMIVLCLTTFGCGGCRNPRVVRCNSCGHIDGVRGGLLPGQGSRCSCGGRIYTVRKLTDEDWEKARARGYVTLEDGEPTGYQGVPTFEYNEIGRRQ